jgi:tagatose 6-phosphate kinase
MRKRWQGEPLKEVIFLITTVTLNVAVDKLYLVDEFQAGEVTRVKECNATAGGKGLNVARVASILGEEVIATGFVGGHNGQYIEEMLHTNGVPGNFIHVCGESRTCVNIIDKSGKSTELLEPGAAVTENDKSEFKQKFKQVIRGSSVVVLSGSVPRGCGSEFYPELIQIAKDDGKQVILDTSGENLKQGIQAKPTMIKPNKDEIKALLSIDVNSKEDVIAAAASLHNGGIPYVVVSMGKHGAIVVCDEGVFEGNPPDVKVVNTVGCGDSMVAAFAVSLVRDYSMEEALQFALAVSSANAMCKQTGFLYRADLKKIMSGGKVTKLA